MAGKFTCTWIAKTLMTLLLVLALPVAAQQDSCSAELMTDFQMPYQEKGSLDQVKIWYDYARDAYVSADHRKVEHRFRNAIRYYWKVVQNDENGTFKVAWSKLADSYRQLNEPDSALVAIYLGLRSFPDNPALHYLAGQIWKSAGAAECAVPHYMLLAQQPGLAEKTRKSYWSILVNLLVQMNDERCIEAQQQVVDLSPDDQAEMAKLARLMDQFGMDAIEALASAYHLNPENPQNARRYAMAVYERGDYREAVAAFQQVVKSVPSNIEARSYLAKSYEGLDQLNTAASEYRAILELKPESLNSLCALASVHGRQGQFAKARGLLRRAMKMDSKSGLPHMVLGEVYENAVSQCSNSRNKSGYSYDDKIVFELAHREYGKAAAKDPNYRSQATRRMRDLKPLLRTVEDKHMHQRNTLKDSCYAWIGTL